MKQDSDEHRFDTRGHLLAKYGVRMTKQDVVFESRMARATIDNMRRPGHARYCGQLKRAEISRSGVAETGTRVLFNTAAIAAWLDGCD